MTVDNISVIDVSPLESDEESALQRVADELCLAANTAGFFYIENHGIAQAQIDEIFSIAKQFFSATDEQKRTVSISAFHRGWLELGEAKMYGSDEPDFKESFVWGLDVADDDTDFVAGGRLLAPNQWPTFLPEMRGKLMAYFEETQACGARLLKAFAKGLDISPGHFLENFDKPLSRGSLIYYPPQRSTRRPERTGTAEHTDYGTLTLLYQDEVGGLEVKGRSGEWLSATPIRGTYVVNVGDLLARWSNDRFESTPHRVVNSASRARFSLASFIDPNWDALITPVVKTGKVARYDPIRCADYITERYDEAFAYRAAGGENRAN